MLLTVKKLLQPALKVLQQSLKEAEQKIKDYIESMMKLCTIYINDLLLYRALVM